VQWVSTSGVNVSWLFIAEHAEDETAGVVEEGRERVLMGVGFEFSLHTPATAVVF
jgi:hypothetical protein